MKSWPQGSVLCCFANTSPYLTRILFSPFFFSFFFFFYFITCMYACKRARACLPEALRHPTDAPLWSELLFYNPHLFIQRRRRQLRVKKKNQILLHNQMRNITFSPILLSVLVQLPIKKKKTPLLQYHSTLSHAHASLAVARFENKFKKKKRHPP